MANENTDRSELDKLVRKTKLSTDNAEKEIVALLDHFIAKERMQESEIDIESLLETLLDTRSEVMEFNSEVTEVK